MGLVETLFNNKIDLRTQLLLKYSNTLTFYGLKTHKSDSIEAPIWKYIMDEYSVRIPREGKPKQ